MSLLDVLVDFARTGRVGPLRCGMSLAEAEDLLGPGRPHPAIVMKGPDINGYPYSWSALDLSVTRRTVSSIRINLWPGSTATLPPLVLPDAVPFDATVLREDMLAALDDAGCAHEVDENLTFGNQSGTLAQPAGVGMIFCLPASNTDVADRDRHYLVSIHKHAS
ncbi:hypothetical protein [Allokutzneria sp. NRRL B-24872]|uniref:hypothetical protein n=1 Tax=Allokutzneria sp. NRRL B-24872 TaxID=1137961 RepID=UPI000A3964CC|nr:hypothetical protein [Allokutzneria sp. NRRL B-24872]